VFPDWVRIDFGGMKSIDHVVVYTLQDNYANPIEPTDTQTFSLYGVKAFTVEGWNGTGWTVLGSVNNNNLVKRTVTFATYTTNAIRINISNALASHSRLVEVEAWGVDGPSLPATTTDLVSDVNPAISGATVALTATVHGAAPTGSVSFTDSGAPITGCSAITLTGSGNAPTVVCSTSTLATGTRAIVANYGGDAANAASSSPPLSQTIQPPAGSSNVALASVGAVATASSQYSGAYPASAVNNGDRKGTGWGNGGGWNDATNGIYPDDVQIDFNSTKTIDRVVVYTLQDNYANPVEPTDTQTFSLYGVTAFTVEGWNGTGWTVLGSVSNNNLVKRTVTFAAYTTDVIRIKLSAALGLYSRIVEVEAFGVSVP